AQMQGVLRFIPRILPGILVVSFAIISGLNYSLSVWFFKRYQIEIRPIPAFIKWDIPWYYVWGIIIGLVLVLIPDMGGTAGAGTGTVNIAVDIIGYNLIIIFGSLYLVLGVSVLFGIFARFKVGFIWKILVFAFLLLFFGFAFIVFPLLGLIDIWANFRRLKRK
ncbi:MAG: YybS family protein, partial [Actinobacteria bacterium]|nr:YybS family protein [Actinomycetota bacterium]